MCVENAQENAFFPDSEKKERIWIQIRKSFEITKKIKKIFSNFLKNKIKKSTKNGWLKYEIKLIVLKKSEESFLLIEDVVVDGCC